MRVLITGGAGFIGSHLVNKLLDTGHDVLVADDLSTGDRARLDAAQARASAGSFGWHQIDVTGEAFAELAREFRPEVICHLAAQISVRDSVADPLRDARLNVLGTVNVCEAARLAGARKIVFASSVATYGMPAQMPVTPATGRDPRSPYAASKLAGEAYLHTYRALHAVDSTTLVLSNVYGPGQGHDGEAGVVPKFVDGLLRGTPTLLFGDGTQTRDYVYVSDVVDAFARACGARGIAVRFNIGTGVPTSDQELHAVVAKAVGAADDPQYAPARPGDLPAMAVDPAPAAAGLGWRPRIYLAEGIAATVAWAREHGADCR